MKPSAIGWNNDNDCPTIKVRSLATERMRHHRERRRNAMECYTIELRPTEILALVG